MSYFDALVESIGSIAERMQNPQRQAAQQYKTVVDNILHSGCRDSKKIEQALDGLLDFCGHEPVLRLYKRLCRHYWDIDPTVTADYIKAYRVHWDNEEHWGPKTP